MPSTATPTLPATSIAPLEAVPRSSAGDAVVRPRRHRAARRVTSDVRWLATWTGAVARERSSPSEAREAACSSSTATPEPSPTVDSWPTWRPMSRPATPARDSLLSRAGRQWSLPLSSSPTPTCFASRLPSSTRNAQRPAAPPSPPRRLKVAPWHLTERTAATGSPLPSTGMSIRGLAGVASAGRALHRRRAGQRP